MELGEMNFYFFKFYFTLLLSLLCLFSLGFTIQQVSPLNDDDSEKFISKFYTDDANATGREPVAESNETAIKGDTQPTEKEVEYIDSWLKGVPKSFLKDQNDPAKEADPAGCSLNTCSECPDKPVEKDLPPKVNKKPKLVLRKKIRIPRPKPIPYLPPEPCEKIPLVGNKKCSKPCKIKHLKEKQCAEEPIIPPSQKPDNILLKSCPLQQPCDKKAPTLVQDSTPEPKTKECSLVVPPLAVLPEAKPALGTKDKQDNLEGFLRELIGKKMDGPIESQKPAPNSSTVLPLSSLKPSIPTTKELPSFPCRDIHRPVTDIHHACPDNCLCILSKPSGPSSVSKNVTIGVSKSQPQYIRSIKPIAKFPFLEEELARQKCSLDSESKEIINKTEIDLLDDKKFGLISALKGFMLSVSKMIFNSVEKSTALHDKRILKAQCEILKHALPQTFIDTILVKETTTLTTAYSVTIPKIIQCMTFETKTETAVSTVTRTVSTGGPDIPVSCVVKPECMQCSYEPPRPTECPCKPSVTDIIPTIAADSCPL